MGMTRSENMSRIRSSNTKPELRLRKHLWATGLRYRLNSRVEGIRPDLVFPGPKISVFVDGCQWHGCPIHYVKPRTNEDFWQAKLRDNVHRDIRQTQTLTESGWLVYRCWEHDVWENLDLLIQDIRKMVTDRVPGEYDPWRVAKVEKVADSSNLERSLLIAIDGSDEDRVIMRKRTTTKWSK